MDEPIKQEQFCTNCTYWFYYDFDATEKTCLCENKLFYDKYEVTYCPYHERIKEKK